MQAKAGPSTEVVGGRDRTGRTFARTDGPVLVEGCCALDGRFVNTLAFVDIIGRSVGSQTSLISKTASGVVGTEVLKDVVFDEGAGGPSVDREVTVTIGVVAT